jgi:hypothetical protein
MERHICGQALLHTGSLNLPPSRFDAKSSVFTM